MKKSIQLKLLVLFGALLLATAGVIFMREHIIKEKHLKAIEPSAASAVNANSDDDMVYDKELPAQEKSQVFVPQWQSYTVAKGDNFSIIGTNELGLTPSEVSQITTLSHAVINLTHLKLGQKIYFLLNKKGIAEQLRFPVKPDIDYLIKRQGNTFNAEKIKKSIAKTRQIYKGVITQSLARAMEEQGVPYALALHAGKLLGKRNNLRRDLRPGDQFDLITVSDQIGNKLFSPKIEAIRLYGHKINTSLFLYSDGQFYDAKGRGLEPGFMRIPLKKAYRVSSPFNLHRRHPITGVICPHYGTDFATPTGTKVIAPADGKVKRIGYQRYAGNYLAIEHYNGYITRYFHLSKVLVKQGEKVHSGQSIALTGNTGRTTGPHLHYELYKRGRAVDSMHTSLPLNRDLHGKELARFEKLVAQRIATLNSKKRQVAIIHSAGINKKTTKNAAST
ncbi:MAG: peptidoglycan DD-metalloendopeptidase family protein [Endozoicomonas sp. (ex Botrylloides leachii)]|nr:peptidoglycan DD-metalloendopeptidase family protein [Endozoicomonas sp. (ex Botrylloides leachii)]